MTAAFYAIGCGLGRMHLSERDYAATSIEPALAVANAYLDGEINRWELTQALASWEGQPSLSGRITS